MEGEDDNRAWVSITLKGRFAQLRHFVPGTQDCLIGVELKFGLNYSEVGSKPLATFW